MKEKFIQEIEDLINNDDIILSEDAMKYFEKLKSEPSTHKDMTDNGKIILSYMQKNSGDATIFTAKTIGAGIGMAARSVSGAIRKLVTDNYVKKTATTPITYTLTELGQNYQLDN